MADRLEASDKEGQCRLNPRIGQKLSTSSWLSGVVELDNRGCQGVWGETGSLQQVDHLVGASPPYYRRNPRWPISNTQDELFFHFQYFFRTNPSLDTPAMSNVYDVHISLSWLAVFILVKSFWQNSLIPTPDFSVILVFPDLLSWKTLEKIWGTHSGTGKAKSSSFPWGYLSCRGY